jgi:hypothetical protein
VRWVGCRRVTPSPRARSSRRSWSCLSKLGGDSRGIKPSLKAPVDLANARVICLQQLSQLDPNIRVGLNRPSAHHLIPRRRPGTRGPHGELALPRSTAS